MIFFLIGSPFVRGRRAKVQAEANKVISERSAEIPDVPQGADIPVGADSMFRPNRNLNSLPCVTGGSHGLFGEAVADEYRAVSRQLNLAELRQRPAGQRYVDNVMRLVSALQ